MPIDLERYTLLDRATRDLHCVTVLTATFTSEKHAIR
jgi:hypothetical protein